MERSAAWLPADTPETAAWACADLTALVQHLRAIGVDGDGLVWIPRGELVTEEDLATLLRDAPAAGLPLLIGVTSPRRGEPCRTGRRNAHPPHRGPRPGVPPGGADRHPDGARAGRRGTRWRGRSASGLVVATRHAHDARLPRAARYGHACRSFRAVSRDSTARRACDAGDRPRALPSDSAADAARTAALGVRPRGECPAQAHDCARPADSRAPPTPGGAAAPGQAAIPGGAAIPRGLAGPGVAAIPRGDAVSEPSAYPEAPPDREAPPYREASPYQASQRDEPLYREAPLRWTAPGVDGR